MTELPLRALPWNAPSTWLLLAACLAFLALGLRAVLDPLGASAFFGVRLEGGAGLAFVQAFGGRNIGLALTALALLALDMRLGLVALLGASALIAGIDCYAVANQAGMAAAAKHLAYVVGLGGFAVWLGLRG